MRASVSAAVNVSEAHLITGSLLGSNEPPQMLQIKEEGEP